MKINNGHIKALKVTDESVYFDYFHSLGAESTCTRDI